MEEITLPQEIVDKVVQAMADSMLNDGLDWSLRQAITKALERRILESGIVDNIADAVVTYVLSDQDAIIEHIGDQFIKAVGDSLSEVYKRVAQAIVKKVKW